MSKFSYKSFSNCDNPTKWMIFLHGYNNTQEEMHQIYQQLLDKNDNLAIITPIGNHQSITDDNRHSWWKISGFDSEGKRFNPETTVEEIAEIYNQVGNILFSTATQLNDFIDEMQNKYNFTDNQTYIAGFSQGAMLGIWTSLIRKNTIKACFSCSGLVVSDKLLIDKLVSKPKIYMIHGRKDNKVLYKCLEYSFKTLKKLKLDVCAVTFDDLSHEISSEEVEFIVSKLK